MITQQEALVFLALIFAFIAGVLTAASLTKDQIAALEAQLRGARKDTAEAGYRAAVAAERARMAGAAMSDLPLPCSHCGAKDSDIRQNGYTFRHGRSYSNYIHACAPCWEVAERERETSRRG